MTDLQTANDPIDVQAAFRDVMASVCTPVSVVTTQSARGPYGTTVSAFASLSLTPPMVLVSLNRTSDLLAAVIESRMFGVNVLARGQVAQAERFATKGGPAKFDGLTWELDNGVPRLPSSCAFMACSTAEMVDGGDHIVLLGRVEAATTTRGDPLTYHDRGFGTHTAF